MKEKTVKFAKWLLDNRYVMKRIDKEGTKYGKDVGEAYTMGELYEKFERINKGWNE